MRSHASRTNTLCSFASEAEGEDAQTSGGESEEIRSAFISCTPKASTWIGTGSSMNLQKIYVVRRADLKAKLMLRTQLEDEAKATTELWADYDTSTVARKGDTSLYAKFEVVEDHYTISAKRSGTTGAYEGTIEDNQQGEIQWKVPVTCK